MWAIKSVEDLDTSHDSRTVSLSYDKVLINPNQKITLIDYDTMEAKIVYRYDTLVYHDAIFKTCETFRNNRKFDIDITKVIGYCELNKFNKIKLRACSKKLYKILDCIERIDVLTGGDGIVVTETSIIFYDEYNIFGVVHSVGDFDISDLITVASLIDNDRLNKMIDDGVIYITNCQSVVKIVLVKEKNIRRLITKLVTMDSKNNFIKIILANRKMRKLLKTVNFGVAYGMGASNLADKMFGKKV